MEPAPLAVPATPQRLRALREADVLSETAYERALRLVTEPPAAATQAAFAARAALILGSLLSLSGLVYFVASNWDGMSRWAKFGVLEAGLVAFAAAAWRARSQLTRQLSLSLCAAMLGPLLAVYGQTYQTGADPYELFLAWALLAVPLAALSRFAPLWAGVWALLNLSAALWWDQALPFGLASWHYALLLHAALNTAGLVAYEVVSRRTTWLGPRAAWLGRSLGVAALLPVLPQACEHLAGVAWVHHTWAWTVAAVASAVLCLGLAVGYRRDRFMRATAAFGACGLAASLAWTAVGERLPRPTNDVVMALIVVLEITLAAWWVRRAGRKS